MEDSSGSIPLRRRTSDALRAVDGLVHTHLQASPVDARVLVNLAVAMLTEFSGAARGALLLESGSGLAPEFAIGPGLKPADSAGSAYDAAVVEEAARKARVVAQPERLAAPVLLGGQVRGVLYLEAGLSPLGPEAQELAAGVATRIATLLHSATLVEDAARRARNVETIEAVGACLSAGTLTDAHLGQVIEAAQRSTGSALAFLGLIAADGETLDLHVRGESDPAGLRELGERVAVHVSHRDLAAAGVLLGEPCLIEPLTSELLQVDIGKGRAPLGFLAVRRRAAPYSDADRTVFRALAHLLSGALARLAYYRKASEDTLTGTGSRLALELAIVEAVENARRSDRPLAVALVDIDRFKEINDRHGHLVGDGVLKSVAEAMRSRLRARDFVARFGGDEFLILLPDTAAGEAAQLAEELRRRVAERSLGGDGVAVSLSIGIAEFPAHGKTPRELVSRADEALYRSKAAGRNRVSVAG